jgi:hypothetical protein
MISMRDKALITAVTPDSILVMPLLTDTCINCAESSCAKRGTTFPVDNPQKFPVACGDVVSIAAKKRATAVQGFFSLLFPIAMAAAGYAAVTPVSYALNVVPSEGIKACAVLVGLAVAVGIVLVISRIAVKHTRAEISEIVRG